VSKYFEATVFFDEKSFLIYTRLTFLMKLMSFQFSEVKLYPSSRSVSMYVPEKQYSERYFCFIWG